MCFVSNYSRRSYHVPGPSQGLKYGGGLVVLGRDNVSPLVEIGLADLPNIGGLKPPQPPPCDGPGAVLGSAKIAFKFKYEI